MPPCHTVPFLQPGLVIQPDATERHAHRESVSDECEYCGSARLEWRKCKLICADCRQINKSCADL
jgi:hypothetical protein